MPESVACNLCGDDNSELLYKARDYRLQVDDEEWNVVRCKSCGLGYLNPRPTPSEIERYYPAQYFDRGGHTKRYKRMSRYLWGSGRLLDIGTARGDFLAFMQTQGWEVEGIEPFGSENPHGLLIHHVHFPNGALPGKFDVITAWAVFEHLHDPALAFKTCAQMLVPGGRLIIQVPNARSIWFHARQEDAPRHLFFFTPKSLKRYAEQSGLKLSRRVHHTTDLFGGGGRGILRLWLVRLTGRSVDEFFEIYRTPRRERFRRWPILATCWTAVGGLERVVLPNWLVRRFRVSGQIVMEFKLVTQPPRRPQKPCPRRSYPRTTAVSSRSPRKSGRSLG